MRTTRMRGRLGVALCVVAVAAAQAPPRTCVAEDDCVDEPSAFRCLQTTAALGAPCTLDYKFNETGFCACQAQACVPLSVPRRTALRQLLVIGDSISLGYASALAARLPAWEVVHAPSFEKANDNNDNAQWHARCARGWLGPNASRWDAVTFNAGLHDLALPDNEHLNVTNYARFLAAAAATLVSALPAATRIVWMRTTPVPTDPPANCVLLPGRIEGACQGRESGGLGGVVLRQVHSGCVQVRVTRGAEARAVPPHAPVRRCCA